MLNWRTRLIPEHTTQPDFDAVIDRRSQRATKWLEVEQLATSGSEKVIPLWIADMEFTSPQPVLAAIRDALDHGVLGYSEWPADFAQVFCQWQASRHQWSINPEWLLSCQSVITALDVIIRAYSEPDDEVIVLSPGFGTFNRVINHTGRNVVEVPLVENGLQYQLDVALIEAKLTPRSRMLILCNPHNPIGKVWKVEELTQIAELCQRHGLLLISDDVHQELILGNTRYTPVAALDERYADFTITFTSPCKTFNLSGLPVAQLVVKNTEIREKLRHELYQLSVHQPDILAIAACDAAYRHGEKWLEALLPYLRENYALLDNALQPMRSVSLFKLEGTYLAWLDFRNSGLNPSELEHKLLNEAGVKLNNGLKFSAAGAGFMRLNFALPRAELVKVIERLQRCFI